MQTGTQLYAPEGFEVLRKGVTYYLLRSDSDRERVLMLEFRRMPLAERKGKPRSADVKPTSATKAPDLAPTKTTGSPNAFRPVVHILSRYRFELGLEEGLIVRENSQAELPPWFWGASVKELRDHVKPRQARKKSHDDRIDAILAHIWPLVQNLDQVLAAESPDALINARARTCQPVQHETRLRTAFYAYICFGFSRWVLHYAVHCIGQWDRMGRERKLGRPSRIYGEHHGHGTNDPQTIERIIEGYRQFSGPGQHLNRVYRLTVTKVFGCVVQTDPSGKKAFVHPAGQPFPSLGQFTYRVGQVFPLAERQTHKYGAARVRNRLTHSQGRFAESVGSLMERTEQDGYFCTEVSIGYLPGSHLPVLCVVRIRCIASGMIVGIGFSVGSEQAAAYRMAQFCAAICKVKFCGLFGMELKHEEWPSIGVSPHIVNDRGPGSTRKADVADPALRPTIKEGTPAYSGQSKASIETTHPKPVKQEGRPQYRETRLSIPQLAVQEVYRTVRDNNDINVASRLNNDALRDRVFPTPVALWNYLDGKGRNHGITMRFEEAVRAYLEPIELTVRDDAVYFKDARFYSDALRDSGALQKAHDTGRFTLHGFMMSVCVRHLWVDLGNELIEVDTMHCIRDGEEQLYNSAVELEQLQELRRDGQLELVTHRMAVRSESETKFEAQTGHAFDQAINKAGRSRRSKANSRLETQEIIGYLRAKEGRK